MRLKSEFTIDFLPKLHIMTLMEEDLVFKLVNRKVHFLFIISFITFKFFTYLELKFVISISKLLYDTPHVKHVVSWISMSHEVSFRC